MNKKTQIVVGQIFGYLVTIFVIALILVFGYRSIANLREKGKETDYLQFKKEIETAVKLNKAFGDSSNEVLTAGDYTKVCFVSYYSQDTCIGSDSCFASGVANSISGTKYPIIKNSVQSQVKKNVFLIKENAEESFFVDGIKVKKGLDPSPPPPKDPDDNFGCIDIIGGKIKVGFKGEGDKTVISTFN